MKKNWNLSLGRMLLASVAALLAATSAYAIPKNLDGRSNDACPDEPRPGPYAFNYAKDIGISCPSDFYVFGEFLLMQSQMEGLEFAITQTHTTNAGGGAFPLRGGNLVGHSTSNHDWNFNPGFRVAFGFLMGHDAWNLEGKWTYMRMKDDTSESIHNNGIMLPLWLPAYTNMDSPYFNLSNRDVSERWTGKYNTLDMILGKPYHVSRYFILNPFFGIRAAWIDQNITARYSGLIEGYDSAEMNAKNDYWGVGLRGGFDGEYLLGRGWNLFGGFAAALLYGKFDVSQSATINSYGFELDQDFYTNTPNFEIKLGIAWGTFFCKNKYHVGLKVAYEFMDWLDINRMRRFLDSGSGGTPATTPILSNMTVANGDLSFNGFAFRLQFDF